MCSPERGTCGSEQKTTSQCLCRHAKNTCSKTGLRKPYMKPTGICVGRVRAAQEGAHDAQSRKQTGRDCVAKQGVYTVKPAYEKPLEAIRTLIWRRNKCSPWGGTQSQAKRACNHSWRMCSSAENISVETWMCSHARRTRNQARRAAATAGALAAGLRKYRWRTEVAAIWDVH